MRRLCQDRGFETGGGALLWLTHVFGSGLEHDETAAQPRFLGEQQHRLHRQLELQHNDGWLVRYLLAAAHQRQEAHQQRLRQVMQQLQ